MLLLSESSPVPKSGPSWPEPQPSRDPEAPPPAYEDIGNGRSRRPVHGTPNFQHSSSSSPEQTTPHPKAANFVSIHRYLNNTEESFFIDPSIRIPQAFLPPLAEGESEDMRKNINITNMMGVVDVDITIVGKRADAVAQRPSRCTVQVKNKMGLSNVRLHAASSRERYPIHLRMFSRAGPMNIHLPRSFVGLITIVGVGPLVQSAGISNAMHSITNAAKGRRYFLGNISSSPWNNADDKSWMGDECVLEATLGLVTLAFDDEK